MKSDRYYVLSKIIGEYPEIEEFKTKSEAVKAAEEYKAAGIECFVSKICNHFTDSGQTGLMEDKKWHIS